MEAIPGSMPRLQGENVQPELVLKRAIERKAKDGETRIVKAKEQIRLKTGQ
jgi:hypothetical protein